MQQVLVLKEYNTHHHYETHHANKYNNLQGQMRNLDRQLKYKVKSLIAFLVAIDESMDIMDVTQLAIFTENDIGVTYGLPYHTEVRWLSRGAMLKCFFNLQEEIEKFLGKRGKPLLEFQSPEWLQDLAFIVNITEHLYNLNKMLQGVKKLSHSILKAYMRSIDTSDLLINIQLEMIDLQCDSDLKNKLTSVGMDTFYQYLLPKYAKLTALAAKVL
uniref:Uncharacterized protein n=1 Tax=Octopus bimaculoides TaxID=37653 RepID=A0A0L8FRP6_OCTBM